MLGFYFFECRFSIGVSELNNWADSIWFGCSFRFDDSSALQIVPVKRQFNFIF
jgi:hypothetical protein